MRVGRSCELNERDTPSEHANWLTLSVDGRVRNNLRVVNAFYNFRNLIKSTTYYII
jgi:hypothetical protein